jgi:hypothetical protein
MDMSFAAAISMLGANSGNFGIANNGAGFGGGGNEIGVTMSALGLVVLNSAAIEGARMKNVVGVAGNSASSQTTSTNNSYDSWFFTNQYFAGEASLKVGTFVDLGIRKIAGITLGEYTEVGYKSEFYNYENKISEFKNHYFEAAAAFFIGAVIKYDLNKGWVDSFSLSEYWIGLEFSRLSTYKWQVFIGFETGISGGLNLGGAVSVKAGWLIK